jgi:CRP-like cAMP-binding protein
MEEVRPSFWRLPFLRPRTAANPAPSVFAKPDLPCRHEELTPPDSIAPATPALPEFMEKILAQAEPDYQDALRILLLQMMDLHKLYVEDPGNYLALQFSAVAAVRKFPGMEAEGMAEKMIYALEQSVRGNLVQSGNNSEMAKWFHTLVNSEELAPKKVMFAAGSTLIRQGERGTRAYLIHSGSVRVRTTDADGRARERAVLKAVALVGEFRLLYNTPASASVVALDEVEAFAIDQEDFRQVLQKNTGLRYWIIQEANQRLQPLLEERLGKARVACLFSAAEAGAPLAPFKDELLASLFIMLNALDEAQPQISVAALANVINLYSKLVNSTHRTQVHTFQAGLPELLRMEAQSLDLLCIFDSAEARLQAATAFRIQEVLRFKGACCLFGNNADQALQILRQTGLTHFDLGRDLHAFVKTNHAVASARAGSQNGHTDLTPRTARNDA